MPAPTMQFEHALNILKGWVLEAALDFQAKLSPNVTVDPVPAGRCVSLDANGNFQLGISGRAMPMFLTRGTDSLTASNDGGNHWTPVLPAGVLGAVVATGGYELETTEFDDSQTYAPNDTLTAAQNNTDGSVGGVLTNQNAVPYTNPVCGVVSRGVRTNEHGVKVLAFWPVYLPVP